MPGIDFSAPHRRQRQRRKPRRLRRLVGMAILLASTSIGIWGLLQNPLAQPLVARSQDSAARSIERAFRDTFTPDWLGREIPAALAAGDAPRVLWLADLAQDEGVALPEAQAAEVARLRAEAEGWGQQTLGCLACSVDIEACPSLGSIAMCNLPLELTPVGDLNALRRQGMVALSGGEIDRLETGLALVGLAATGAVLVSGGGSLVVKAGATGLRTARRIGSLTPDMARVLGDMADLPVNWRAVLRAAPAAEITDMTKLARLEGLAGDLGRVAKNSSITETVVLMRHVDSAEDAARLARFSDVAGPKTYSRMEVLGKSRAFRALVRVSDLALSAMAAVYVALLHLALTLAQWLGTRVLRGLLR